MSESLKPLTLMLLLGETALCQLSVALADTISVDRFDDDPTAMGCSDAVANDCSVRGAFAFAAQAPGDDQINVPEGTFVLNNQLHINGVDDGNITVTGTGVAPSRLVADARVLLIEGSEVKLQNLNLIGEDLIFRSGFDD